MDSTNFKSKTVLQSTGLVLLVLLVIFRERKKKKNIDLLCHVWMHSLVDSYLSPGIKPATLGYQDNALTNWATWGGPEHSVLNKACRQGNLVNQNLTCKGIIVRVWCGKSPIPVYSGHCVPPKEDGNKTKQNETKKHLCSSQSRGTGLLKDWDLILGLQNASHLWHLTATLLNTCLQ